MQRNAYDGRGHGDCYPKSPRKRNGQDHTKSFAVDVDVVIVFEANIRRKQ